MDDCMVSGLAGHALGEGCARKDSMKGTVEHHK
jgi:hypothetical protein